MNNWAPYKKYQDMNNENSAKNSSQYLDIKYEDLILNSDMILDEVFKYLGVEIDYPKLNKIKNSFDKDRINAYKKKDYTN